MTTRTLVLIGRGVSPVPDRWPDGTALVWWERLDVPAGSRSLPLLVEASAEDLRSEYVDWCASLATAPVAGGESVAAALRSDLLSGGSFWWTTTVAGRSPFSSPAVYDVLRLRALEKVYLSGHHDGLRYIGADEALGQVLTDWCSRLGHRFQWERTGTPLSEARHRRAWVEWVPHGVRALVQLGRFLRDRYLPSRAAGHALSEALPGADLTIFTYFPNIDVGQSERGTFRSHYWGPLHDQIARLGLSVSWIWLYQRSQQLTYPQSARLRTQLNGRSATTGQRHILLEERMTPRDVLAAVDAYVELARTSTRLEPCRARFTFPGSHLNFFDVLKEEWYSSLRGAHAMISCLYAAALRAATRDLRATARMLYIWENQGWEHSLLAAWRAVHPGVPALGVAHTPSCTARMHLPTVLRNEPVGEGDARRIPDQVVTLGAPAEDTLRRFGWPAERVTVAEALRFTGLAGRYGTEWRPMAEDNRHLLVVTSITASETAFQLQLLSEASRIGGLASYTRMTIKPHPFYPVDDLVRSLSFSCPVTIKLDLLETLFSDVDVVFSSNSTSAAVVVAWVGLPLVLTAPYDGPDMNPLTGLPGASFVATPQALAEQLARPARVELSPDTFLLDADLPRWRQLLTAPLPVWGDGRA